MWTYLTIFFAIACWTGAICAAKGNEKLSFRLWLAGLVIFVVHIIAAFSEFYQWSHQKAVEETARQTEELFGWDSGVGLYFNYAFLVCLIADVVWQIKRGANHRCRTAIDLLVAFMILNGAIVFGGGAAQIIGGLSLLLIAVSLIRRRSG